MRARTQARTHSFAHADAADVRHATPNRLAEHRQALGCTAPPHGELRPGSVRPPAAVVRHNRPVRSPPCATSAPGLGLTPATSAPGLGPPPPTSASRLGPPRHICTGTGPAPAHICAGTGPAPAHLCAGTARFLTPPSCTRSPHWPQPSRSARSARAPTCSSACAWRSRTSARARARSSTRSCRERRSCSAMPARGCAPTRS